MWTIRSYWAWAICRTASTGSARPWVCPPSREQSAAAPALTCLLLHSLAARYAEVVERLRVHTGRQLRRVVMVGGGAQNAMLRRLTAERTGLEVVQGPAESATVGNFAVQLAALEAQSAGIPRVGSESVAGWARALVEPSPSAAPA